MQGPLNISTLETQQALIDSSYLDDIIFLGFINDEQRDWLYANSLAFVFPSKYEGFGLPVLEALAHRSPVIAYENSAVREVAEDIPMYAQDYKSLMSAITDLINSPDKQLRHIKDVGYKHAIKYNWRATSDKVIAAITQTSK